MPVIKNSGMKRCNNHHGDGLCSAPTFMVTIVSQYVGDAASQACGAHTLAASALMPLGNGAMTNNSTGVDL